ncbi:MAG: 23S rRNA (uracil(1939)-C(5))-methyltransferase RlmD [Planctomycetes bacterium]|nr:23S rRNA (uracil(1939)-C(5))-methyltransferase RlmD [Planctomycetota bacterium]
MQPPFPSEPGDDPFEAAVPVRPGDTVELLGERWNAAGECVATLDGYEIRVEDLLPGERADVQVLAAAREHGRGVVRTLIEAVAERADPSCAHFGGCSGCTMQHVEHSAQLRMKTETVRQRFQRALEREDVPVADCLGPHEPFGDRHRLALQIHELHGQLAGGLPRLRSGAPFELTECPATDPAALRVARAAVDAAHRLGIEAWNPRNDAGTLRAVITRSNGAGDVVVTLVVRDARRGEHRALVDALCAEPIGARGVSVNVNPGGRDRLLGPRTEHAAGDAGIEESIGDTRFVLAHNGFFRSSRFTAAAVVETVQRLVEPNRDALVLDLYSGMGLLALTLAPHTGRVVAIEEHPRAIHDAERSARANGLDNVEFRQTKVEGVLREFVGAGVHAVVLDPPPDGCGRFVLNALTKEVRPERIVYTSSSLDAIAEDTAVLVQRGYNLQAVQPIDAGPHTPAVECVVLCGRRLDKGKRVTSVAQARRLLRRLRGEG